MSGWSVWTVFETLLVMAVDGFLLVGLERGVTEYPRRNAKPNRPLPTTETQTFIAPTFLPHNGNSPLRNTMEDIDDILREFDSQNAPSNAKDYDDLLKWWINERAAPEILQYQEDLVERIMTRVRRQVKHSPSLGLYVMAAR